MTLAAQIAALPPGKHQLTVDGLHVVIYYDEHEATGDNGRRVRGDVTGEYEVFEQTDPADDLIGLVEIHRQHVSPHGTSGYGNPLAKTYAAERCAQAILRKAKAVSTP